MVGHKENGAPIFRYIYAATQKELTAKLRKSITAYQGVDLTEQSRVTLSQWMDQWLEDKAGTIRPKTLANHRGYIKNHIEPALGHKQISLIKAADIRKFYARISNELASCTVRCIHTTLRGILGAAVQARLIPSNPTEEVGAPKFNCKPKQVLTDEQLDTFMETIKEDLIWHDFFYTELTTGLRRGELCSLRWEDLDAEHRTLHVRHTLHKEKGKPFTTGDTKIYTGTRKIVLPPSTARLLTERRKTALTEWIFPDPVKPEMPTDPGTSYNRLKVLLKQAGLPDIRFHDLRHTFATHALASGVDIKTLSGILGHTQAAFTLDTYTHTTGDMQKRAAEIVAEFMTDIFGEELKPWEESAKAAKAQSG